ncbi:hypothetical protein Oter_1116 [Opitutus terrae PB90-1]|uniref:Uncharacterized protein n=1 Tax=Opitutus terrae (strain DSM 11246 / JCM 15787 / PB90-1) TaxID=452637 RepID=B1ZNH0_OPITP|nr:hypothetical protein Oter_1116 [Opitutus terrae PB90-1]
MGVTLSDVGPCGSFVTFADRFVTPGSRRGLRRASVRPCPDFVA